MKFLLLDMDEVLKTVVLSKEKVHIVSGNPEVLYTGLNDKKSI